jgi:hypothetical protein
MVSITAHCYATSSLSLDGFIWIARAFNSEHQMELVNEIASKFAEEKNYRLLVG